jgi:hypothetical protein
MKATFPLAAQVEIDYAIECLCRHYYFVQDKTIERDGAVPQASFNKMQNSLTAEVKRLKEELLAAIIPEGQMRAPVARQVSMRVVNTDEFKPYVPEKNTSVVPVNEIDFSDLKGKIIAYRIMQTRPRKYWWYEGEVTEDKGNGHWIVHYSDDNDEEENLVAVTYGVKLEWVVLQLKRV